MIHFWAMLPTKANQVRHREHDRFNVSRQTFVTNSQWKSAQATLFKKSWGKNFVFKRWSDQGVFVLGDIFDNQGLGHFRIWKNFAIFWIFLLFVFKVEKCNANIWSTVDCNLIHWWTMLLFLRHVEQCKLVCLFILFVCLVKNMWHRSIHIFEESQPWHKCCFSLY